MDISLSYGRGAQGDAASAGVGEYFRAQPRLQHRHADQSEDNQYGDDGKRGFFAPGDGEGHGATCTFDFENENAAMAPI